MNEQCRHQRGTTGGVIGIHDGDDLNRDECVQCGKNINQCFIDVYEWLDEAENKNKEFKDEIKAIFDFYWWSRNEEFRKLQKMIRKFEKEYLHD